jgi:hypothetical protein
VSKVTTSVFWDNAGILLVSLLEEGSILTESNYTPLLGEVKQKMVFKRRGKLSK